MPKSDSIIEVSRDDKLSDIYKEEIDAFIAEEGHSHDFAIILFQSQYDQNDQLSIINTILGRVASYF